jgi:hypothetical protein
MGRSESGHDNNDEAWDDEGSMGMKEKEVGVVSDCNTVSRETMHEAHCLVIQPDQRPTVALTLSLSNA